MKTHRLLAALALAALPLGRPAAAPPDASDPGPVPLAVPASQDAVTVRGRQLLRDGQPWVPHGYYQIAFEVAPANRPRADHPFWANAYDHYSPDEYRQMRAAGADSVRLQLAQAAADPQDPLYDAAFVAQAMDAVRAARRQGLVVMLCVQAESHVPGEAAIDLPDEGTRRVWSRLAPAFADDPGVMYELLNEPRPAPGPVHWQQWQAAMTATLDTVRRAGARNVVVADGLGVGQVLDGAPLLADAQVVYAAHPYALAAHGQTPAAWEEKFGRFAGRAPVIVTEWIAGSYYCDADTARSTVAFLHYLADRGIGLEAGVWDWTSGGFGSARWGFPRPRPSSFVGLGCHEPGFGMGLSVDAWYRTGVPPLAPL